MSNDELDKKMMTPEGREVSPSLRFPEFKDADGWTPEELGGVAEIVSERISLDLLSLNNYISTENIVPDYEGVVSATKLPSSGSATRFKKNDVLISNIRPYLKKVWFASKDGGASNDVIVMRAKSEIKEQFLSFILKNDTFIGYVMRGAKGVKMPRGDISLMMEYPVAYPSFQEQQKIADCLSSVDELISAETKKLDALKTHKKGLIQSLFPTEGETVPKLRFPEFRSDGVWQEKSLNQITTSIFDGTHQTPTYTDKGVPFFSVENIVSGKSNKFISREDYLDATTKNKPEKGDVLITRIGNIGYSTVVDWSYEFSIYVTLAVIKRDERFNSHYLHGYLQSPQYQAEIRSKSLLNAVPCKINMDELRKTKVFLPLPSEQEKIAVCMSSIDELISAEVQKLDALNLLKKGLIQQLFPSMYEVLG